MISTPSSRALSVAHPHPCLPHSLSSSPPPAGSQLCPSPACRYAKSPDCTRLRSVAFQWFFMALSVRPGRWRVSTAHWLPITACSSTSCSSSCSDQSLRLMLGSRWLCHLQDQERYGDIGAGEQMQWETAACTGSRDGMSRAGLPCSWAASP